MNFTRISRVETQLLLFSFKNAVLEKNIISKPIDSHHQIPINKPVSRSNKFELIELIESLKYKIERFV